MKLLLTSGGITNPGIRSALVEMLDKPMSQCRALCISTASYAHPMAGPEAAWRFISGREETPMTNLGWKSVGVLELTALPSLGEDLWHPWVQNTDVFLVNGGDPMFLSYWMQKSGLAGLLPTLPAVWVGLSAGSMIMTPRIGREFIQWSPPNDSDETLGFVDFSIFPHLNHESLPWNTMANAERWAANIPGPAYAIDDQTAFRVIDGVVEIITEGHWELLHS